VAKLTMEAPRLLSMDRKDRGDFLRHFYRRYEDAPARQLAEDSRELANDLLLAKAFPAAIRRVREHRALGHRTLLITGALDFVVEPLAPLFDDIVCASMSVKADGSYSGELTDVPPTGETRAQALYDYCDANGFDPRESVAYADSSSDLPLLDAAGFPVCVNPETKLAAIARSRGWLVEHWDKASGALPRLPVAPKRASSLRRLGSVIR
jgi:HAD superfamily hydrolase (TIGR01490 family)